MNLPSGSDKRTDPVTALLDYITRTNVHRANGTGAVFLSLSPPFKPLSSDSISRILCEAIQLAGLSGPGYSAKDFRPTGATTTMDKHIDPKTVQRLGRWKTDSVFYDHYAHSRTPANFTDTVLRSSC